MKKLIGFIAFILILSFFSSVLFGCNVAVNKPNDKIKVVCTLFPQYDFVRRIAEDKADVILLVSPGSDVHSLDPTSQQIINVSDADLFIRIDEEFETWSDTLIESSENKKLNVFNLADELRIKLKKHDHDSETDHGGDDGEYTEVHDYHIWTSLDYAKKMVKAISSELCRIDSANKSFYEQNTAAYTEELNALDSKLTDVCSNSKRNSIVFAGRFALSNFADEYNLRYSALFESCTEDSNPDARKVAEIISTVKDEKIPVIFCEELGGNSDTAQSISDETGAEIAVFYSCHNLSKDDFDNGETYLSLMQKNLESLKKALG